MKKQLLSLLLCLALCLSMAACHRDEPETTAPESTGGLTAYTVRVRTNSGQYLQNVGVRVFADPGLTELIWYDKTDETGTMTFLAEAFDGYLVTLEKVPEGYAVAESYTLTGLQTEITLTVGLINGDLSELRLKPGDRMAEMALTTADGTAFSLSAMLAQRQAVALFFFDSGCTDDLAAPEQAWKSCPGEMGLIALDAVDPDVADFAAGLSMPVAACPKSWIGILGLTDLPTLVIIDRFGTISLLHTGALSGPEDYADVFAYYTRPDYTAGVVTDVNTIIGREPAGSAENPYEQDASQDIMISVAPDKMVYYRIRDARGRILQIRSANAWVQYEQQQIQPVNGVITIPIDTDEPVLLGIGNAGRSTELFVASFSYQAGTAGNPNPLDLGQFTAQLAAGDEDGVFYQYRAAMPGVLRLRCTEETPDVVWTYAMVNLNTGTTVYSHRDEQVDELTGERYVLLEVSANDLVQLCVATQADELTGEYPAGDFRFLLTYDGGTQQPDPTDPAQQTDFSVTVRDAYGSAMPGVTVSFTDSTGDTLVQTDDSGVARYTSPFGAVRVHIELLQWYTVPKADFDLTADTNNVSVVFTGKMEGTPVTLPVGNAYAVELGENYAVMRADRVNYFLFTPDRAGVYRFATDGTLSFWGTDAANPVDGSAALKPEAGGMTLIVPQEDVGRTHILGIRGIPCGTLDISYLGEAPAPADPTDPTVDPTTPDTPTNPTDTEDPPTPRPPEFG